MTLYQLKDTLKTTTYRLHNEARLQAQIESVLKTAGIAHSREVVLSSADRIDFLTKDGFGIEVKINKAANSLIRQAGRYLKHEKIKALLVVTIRPISLPEEIFDKPVENLALWNRLSAFS